MANIARDGAPKRSQVVFPVRDTMKEMTEFAAGPVAPGSGPDASDANPMAEEPLMKEVDTDFDPAWDCCDGDGYDGDGDIGDEVLSEAVISGGKS